MIQKVRAFHKFVHDFFVYYFASQVKLTFLFLPFSSVSSNTNVKTTSPRSIRPGRKRSDTLFSDRLRQLLTVYDTIKNGRNTIAIKWAIYSPETAVNDNIRYAF
jgi:hypothetical protein